jgi:hypothetical protein
MWKFLTAVALLVATACSPAPSPSPSPSAPTPEPSASASSAAEESPEAANVAALAGIYEFTPVGEAEPTCLIRLDADDQGIADEPVRLAWTTPRCWEPFPALRKLERWAPVAAGSLKLIDDAGNTIGEFSPVQDGTGVYLRGGAGGAVFQMKQPTW